MEKIIWNNDSKYMFICCQSWRIFFSGFSYMKKNLTEVESGNSRTKLSQLPWIKYIGVFPFNRNSNSIIVRKKSICAKRFIFSNMWTWPMTWQQLQLRSSRKSHKLWPSKQPRCCCNRPNYFLQDGFVVLDDPSITKAFMPQCYHRTVDAIKFRHISRSCSWLWAHHQHHQWWNRMW